MEARKNTKEIYEKIMKDKNAEELLQEILKIQKSMENRLDTMNAAINYAVRNSEGIIKKVGSLETNIMTLADETGEMFEKILKACGERGEELEIATGLLEANQDASEKAPLQIEDIVDIEEEPKEETFDFKKQLEVLRERKTQERNEQERQWNEIMNTIKLLKEELEDLKKVTTQNTYDLAYLKSQK